MADCRVGHVAGQVLATYALGSCIGLSVYDPKAADRNRQDRNLVIYVGFDEGPKG